MVDQQNLAVFCILDIEIKIRTSQLWFVNVSKLLVIGYSDLSYDCYYLTQTVNCLFFFCLKKAHFDVFKRAHFVLFVSAQIRVSYS